MSLSSTCPDQAQFLQLLSNLLGDREKECLDQHLRECTPCAQAIQALKVEDARVQGIQGEETAPTEPLSAAFDLLSGHGPASNAPSGVQVQAAGTPQGVTSATSAWTPLADSSRTVPEEQVNHLQDPCPSGPTPAPETIQSIAPQSGPAPQDAADAVTVPPTGLAPLDITEEMCQCLAPPQGPGELGRLGRYRILSVLGAGGMGVVFLAEDPHLHRDLAVKAMLPALAGSPANRQRFLREARATAAIEHDHIIRINEVAEDRGVPFLAMPLLQGEPLDKRLKRDGKLPVTEVLRIGREIAEGLAAAHEHGLIHRDIKPGNIWLEGNRARVKILDFGLARAVADTTQLTQSGAIVGTPAYMAPEQTRAGAVDHRTDLFSLGCVLYRMSTGEAPFKGTDLMSILAALALDTPPSPREVNPQVPPSLSGFIMQLLNKRPQDRPQSAQEVVAVLEDMEHGKAEAADGGEVLPSGQPVLRASGGRKAEGGAFRGTEGPSHSDTELLLPPGRARPFRWFMIAVLPLLLLGFISLLSWGIIRIATNKGVLVIETEDPDVEVMVKQGGELVRIIDTKTGREISLRTGTYHLELAPGKDDLRLSTDQFTLERGSQQIVKVWRQPAARVDPVGEIRRFKGSQGGVECVAFGPDGRSVFSGGQDNALRLWEVDGGREIRRFVGHTDVVQCLAVSPDGHRLLSGSFDNTIRLWDVDSGREIRRFVGHKGWVFGVAFPPDGQRALSAGSIDNTMRLWDVDSGREIRRFDHPGRVLDVTFSPDGHRALSGTGDDDSKLRLWDLESGQELRRFEGHYWFVWSVALSSDGHLALSGGYDKTMRLWDVETGKELGRFNGHTGPVRSVVFSPDGRRALSGSSDRTVRVWDVETRKELGRFKQDEIVENVAFSPDDRLALSGGWDKTMRLWQLPKSD